MEKYLIGDLVVIGNMVCKPSHLTAYKESDFFKILENSLKKHKFEQQFENYYKEKFDNGN